MNAETVLGLVLAVGPYPGGTLYSQTPVEKGSSLVISAPAEDHGRNFRAYRFLEEGEDPPHACSQKGNPVCRRPRYEPTLKRWQRPETYLEGLDRYWDISKAISSTKLSPELLEFAVVVFRHESGMFRRDVHEGTNHKPWRDTAPYGQEDGGLAWGFGQIHWSTEPDTKLPIRGFEHLRMRDLVGLDEASTFNGVQVPIVRLQRIVKRCGQEAPSCVFTSYGGTVSAKHPLIKERLDTYRRVKRIKAEDRTLSTKVRNALGLGADA